MQLIDCREMTKCHQKSCFPPFRKTNSKFCFHFLNQNTGNNLLPLRELGAAGPVQRRSRTRSSPAPRLLLRRRCNRSFLPQRQRPDDQSEMCIKPEQDLSLLYSQGNPQGCSRLSRRQHPSDHTITMGQNKSQNKSPSPSAPSHTGRMALQARGHRSPAFKFGPNEDARCWVLFWFFVGVFLFCFCCCCCSSLCLPRTVPKPPAALPGPGRLINIQLRIIFSL